MTKILILRKPPKGPPLIRRERTYQTVSIQNKKTGKMMGRRRVKGKGDGTGIRRVQEDYTVVRGSPGKRGYVRKNMSDGMIDGRF